MANTLRAIAANGAVQLGLFVGAPPLLGWSLKRLMGRGDVRLRR